MYLKDYRPPGYRINRTELYFDLREECVIVTSRLEMERVDTGANSDALELQGDVSRLPGGLLQRIGQG